MKNFSLTLTTREQLNNKLNELLANNPDQAFYVHVTKKEKARGLPANAQQHVFYSQISKYYEGITPLDAKRMCKHLFGVAICLSSKKLEPVTSYLIDKLGYHNYLYENQIKLMDVIVRTSDFSHKESKQYMDEIIMYFNGEGVPIKYQDD